MMLLSLILVMLLPLSLGLTYLYLRDNEEMCDWLAAIQWFVLGACLLSLFLGGQNP